MTLVGRKPEAMAGEGGLERARRGEVPAFNELLAVHEGRVFSIALRFTGRWADAEELTQDVFVQLYGALGQIADEDHLKRWLLRTVTYRCLDRLRDSRRRPTLVSMDALPAEAEPIDPERETDPLANGTLRRLLLELAPDARAVVLLRFQEDLDPSEVAAVLAMSVNTVKSHLRRSLDWLRSQFPGERHGTLNTGFRRRLHPAILHSPCALPFSRVFPSCERRASRIGEGRLSCPAPLWPWPPRPEYSQCEVILHPVPPSGPQCCLMQRRRRLAASCLRQ